MGKTSYDDKMHIQFLRELDFGYIASVAKFQENNRKSSSARNLCQRF